MSRSLALGLHETTRIRGLLIFGFTVVGLLCCLTGIDFIFYRAAFPVWFTPVFLGGIIALVGMISFCVRALFPVSQPLAFQQWSNVRFLWILLPISFFCTSSVHRFYPFRLDIAEYWTRGYDGLPMSVVLKFNFVLTATGVVVTAVLAAAYAFGWRRIALVGLLVFAAVLLVPNCDCGNAFNLRWIRYVGASPLMFIPNVLVILVACSAFLGIRPNTACVAVALICISTLVLGLGHITAIIW